LYARRPPSEEGDVPQHHQRADQQHVAAPVPRSAVVAVAVEEREDAGLFGEREQAVEGGAVALRVVVGAIPHCGELWSADLVEDRNVRREGGGTRAYDIAT